jgi:hypothetical protein
MDIFGKLDVSGDFQNFTIEYGQGDNPVEWNALFERSQPVSQVEKIYSWDLKSIPTGLITLRITMHSIRGGYAERLIHFNIQVSTPTPTMTPTATTTATPTSTPFVTHTPVPTYYPTPTQTPTPQIVQPTVITMP